MISPSLTLRTFAHHCYFPSHPHLADASRLSIKYALNRWEEATENPVVQAITAADLYAIVQSCSALSPHTARGYLSWIKVLIRHAHDLELIDKLPKFPRVRCRTKLKPTPTMEDAGRMFAVAHEAGLSWPTFEPPAQFWRRWIVVSYFTGLRLADMMFNLTSDCVKPDALIHEAQKTGKLLAVPLCPILAGAVTYASATAVPSGATIADPAECAASAKRIFPVSNSPHLIRRELRKLSEAAETSVRVTPHGLRRLSITEWSAASETAGRLIHGCGVSGVMASYLNVLRPLERARPMLAVPEEFTRGVDRQKRLF